MRKIPSRRPWRSPCMAYGRALCARRFPHLFADQTAAELLEKIDCDFSTLERKSEDLLQTFGALEPPCVRMILFGKCATI